MKILDEYLDGLPEKTRRAVGAAGSFALGLLMALLMTYVLYRIGLPSKPFIYVAF